MIRSVACAAVTGLVLGNLAFIFGHTLLGIYTGSPDVIEEGMTRLAVICTTYALCGMMDTMVGVMRGLGYSIVPMIVSLVGACGLRLLWLGTFFQISRFHTIVVVYLSISDIVVYHAGGALRLLCPDNEAYQEGVA